MTKAGLLRRYRWFPVVLPFAAAAGGRAFRSCFGAIILSVEPSSFTQDALVFLHRVSDFGLPAWALLTLPCSVWTAHTLRVDAKLSGKKGVIFVLLIAPFIFFLQAMLGAVFFL